MQYPAFLRLIATPLATGVLLAAVGPAVLANTADAPADPPVPWTAPSAESVEAAIVEWIAESSTSADEAAKRQAIARPELDQLFTSADRLDTVMACLCMTHRPWQALSRSVVMCPRTPWPSTGWTRPRLPTGCGTTSGCMWAANSCGNITTNKPWPCSTA